MPTMHEYATASAALRHAPLPNAEVPLQVGKLVTDASAALDADSPEMTRSKDYLDGDQLAPYAPRDTTDQIRDTQKRSITNLMPLLVALPSQVCTVDGYRRGNYDPADPDGESNDVGVASKKDMFSPEYKEWQRNRMDARQSLIYRTALTYGQCFVLADNVTSKRLKIDVLPTRHTAGFFRDSANDIRPEAIVTFKAYPTDEADGLAVVYDEVFRYEVYFDEEGNVRLNGEPVEHGCEDGCPAVRYHAWVDDEGTIQGIIQRATAGQDRVNQAVFGTNITADHSAFKTRTAAGLTPTYKRGPDGEPLLDPVTGNPIAEPIEVSQARMLVSTDSNTKFDTLDETPMDGYIANEEQALRNFATANQFPPHIFLGNIANLSAEALDAAEAQFRRFVSWLQLQWGDSHEELFRIISDILGDRDGAEAFGGEVRWGKFELRSFAAWMDGLAKGVESLGIPQRGAWAEIPGMTSGTLEHWDELKEREKEQMEFGPDAGFDVSAARENGPPVVPEAPVAREVKDVGTVL